jgi:hypothetical protein
MRSRGVASVVTIRCMYTTTDRLVAVIGKPARKVLVLDRAAKLVTEIPSAVGVTFEPITNHETVWVITP